VSDSILSFFFLNKKDIYLNIINLFLKYIYILNMKSYDTDKHGNRIFYACVIPRIFPNDTECSELGDEFMQKDVDDIIKKLENVPIDVEHKYTDIKDNVGNVVCQFTDSYQRVYIGFVITHPTYKDEIISKILNGNFQEVSMTHVSRIFPIFPVNITNVSVCEKGQRIGSCISPNLDLTAYKQYLDIGYKPIYTTTKMQTDAPAAGSESAPVSMPEQPLSTGNNPMNSSMVDTGSTNQGFNSSMSEKTLNFINRVIPTLNPDQTAAIEDVFSDMLKIKPRELQSVLEKAGRYSDVQSQLEKAMEENKKLKNSTKPSTDAFKKMMKNIFDFAGNSGMMSEMDETLRDDVTKLFEENWTVAGPLVRGIAQASVLAAGSSVGRASTFDYPAPDKTQKRFYDMFSNRQQYEERAFPATNQKRARNDNDISSFFSTPLSEEDADVAHRMRSSSSIQKPLTGVQTQRVHL